MIWRLIVIVLLIIGGFLALYLITPHQSEPLPLPPLDSGGPKVFDEGNQGLRQTLMQDVSSKIGSLSPQQPVLGGSWQVIRFEFIDDKNFYVEFEDGHVARKILLSATGRPGSFDYKTVGFFEPGMNLWELIEGDDPYFGSNVAIYEFSEEDNKWVRSN